MSEGNADERAGGKPTYGKALDTWASVRIMNILDLSSIAIEGGNFSLGIDKINDAWEVLPNDIKAKFISPRSEIFNALRQVPTHDSLISDNRFADDEEIETWRYKFAANLIKSMIGDYKDRMVQGDGHLRPVHLPEEGEVRQEGLPEHHRRRPKCQDNKQFLSFPACR